MALSASSTRPSLPKGIEPVFVAPSSLATSVTAYRHATALSDRYFCSTCGCHIGDVDVTPEPETGKPAWRVATSIFALHTEDIFQIRAHCYTRSAPGGAIHDWLTHMGDRELKVWNPASDDANVETTAPQADFDAARSERLRAQCHCGGVSFTIPRPPAASDDAVAARLTSPLHRDRWVGSLDVCDDCRLLSGAHVTAWTSVPLALIEPRIGPDLLFGTLQTFSSSKDVLRAFCGTCGAMVLFSCTQGPQETRAVDLSVGILRAPEGVAAEKWLTWRTGRFDWYKSGLRYDEVFTKSLKSGMDEWGVKKYGQSLDFKIGESS